MGQVIRYILALLVLSSWIYATGYAQKNTCVENIRKYIRKINSVSFPEEGTTHYMHYKNKLEMWPGASKPSVDLDVTLKMSHDQLHYLTNDIDVYQDKRDAFMVIDSKKTVFWSSSVQHENKERRVEEAINFKDTLFLVSDYKPCEIVRLNGRKYQKLTMIVQPAFRKKFQMKQLTFWYDVETQEVKKVKTIYTRSYQVKTSVLEMIEMDFDYHESLRKPVAELILNRRNQLQYKYRDYHLIDNRQ